MVTQSPNWPNVEHRAVSLRQPSFSYHSGLTNQDSQKPHLCRVACTDRAKLVSRRGISRSRCTYGKTKSRNEIGRRRRTNWKSSHVEWRPRSLVL